MERLFEDSKFSITIIIVPETSFSRLSIQSSAKEIVIVLVLSTSSTEKLTQDEKNFARSNI
mgnify:CR=1 FL=1|jgi:hypothetical protein|tara:strand:+ start:1085 stop:1267 length:183 start_codon:yes stop_codon:yes gene_type:complete